MDRKRSRHFQMLGTVLFTLLVSTPEVLALERWLVPNTSQCAADTVTNPCYLNLADAVAAASGGDSIKILPGTYSANVTLSLSKNVNIYGVETARTFLTGNGSTAISVSAVTAAMDIRNITFINASPAIQVSNGTSAGLRIMNNIFEVAGSATAISVTDTLSSPVIFSNTFHGNGTAILSSQTNLNVINNIFSNNGTAISTNIVIDNIRSNLFWQNGTIGNPNILLNAPGDPNYKQNATTQDPQFVVDPTIEGDLTKRDFHLKSTTTTSLVQGDVYSNSNSINGVTPPDIGAYGGSSSDTIPFVVSGLTGTSSTGTTIDLTWSKNGCYMITGYNIYFSVDRSGAPYDNDTSPFDAGNPASFPFQLTVTPPAPPLLTAPANLSSSPSSGTLTMHWAPVAGATGYEVSFKKTTDMTFTVLPLINTTSVEIKGLTDPQGGVPTYYDISVRPYYQATFYLAVKDYYSPNLPPATNPKEALLFSNEAIVSVGTPTFGPASAIQDFPEPITATPALPNNGCFIATAAYGSYSSSQVQALRAFRDQYLLTNGPGRAFVRWYYTHGPRGAQFLNDHPEWKPLVRTALLPAVIIALFLTHTSAMTKMLIVLLTGLSVVLLYHRKKPHLSGGVQ